MVQPIILGAPDDADTGVVQIGYKDFFSCTGTVIAPRVVLTAGHCVAGVRGRRQLTVTVDLTAGDSPATVDVLEVRPHPRFDPVTLANDIALVLLAEPLPARVGVWPLWRSPFDGSVVDREVRMVGYGQTGSDDQAPGRRRDGKAAISAFDETRFWLRARPSRPCGGDSGGPVLVMQDGVEFVAGVISAGDPLCSQTAVNTRVDTYVESFIAPYLAEVDARGVPAESAPGCSLAPPARGGGLAGAPFLVLLMASARRNRRNDLPNEFK